MTTIGVCESCAGEGEVLARVQRYYVTPERWDTPGKVEAAGEERWCVACRTHYPHVLLEGDFLVDPAVDRPDTPE